MKFPDELRVPFLTILFFFLCLFLYTKIAGPVSFSVNNINTNKGDIFSVEGTGKETAVPDTALVSIGVTERGDEVEETKNRINEKSKKIIDELKRLGIEEENIETTNYSVTPSYGSSDARLEIFPQPDGEITGYSVTQNLEVRVKEIDRAEKAIDVATQNGANILSGVTFVLDDEDREELEHKARQEAIAKAKDKAERIADAAGIRLGRVINVSESFGSPYNLERSAAISSDKMVEPSMPTELSPGETNVEITVYLSFETL